MGRPGDVLGASWARLGAVLGPPWESWGVLGKSWGRLETPGGRLWAHFIAKSSRKRSLIDFDYENGPSKPVKIIRFRWFYNIRELFAVFQLRSILDAILVPECHHFGRIFDAQGGLGVFWGLLGTSWDRLGTSWPRLGAS